MDTTLVKLAPSILAADFARLGEQVAQAEQAGANRIHVDVMDGHFVPNLSMGPAIVASLRQVTRLPLEVHLMVSEPDAFLDAFADAGANSFLVHWESNSNLHRTIERVKRLSKSVGVVINPATPAAVLEEVLPQVQQVLVMTVDPGFGHQQFLPSSVPKIRRVRELVHQLEARCDIEVDGGIDVNSAPLAVAAGANVLVAGSSIFGERGTVAAAMQSLRKSLERLQQQAAPVQECDHAANVDIENRGVTPCNLE
jgi:ribulose-phosphate 3-epimerase